MPYMSVFPIVALFAILASIEQLDAFQYASLPTHDSNRKHNGKAFHHFASGENRIGTGNDKYGALFRTRKSQSAQYHYLHPKTRLSAMIPTTLTELPTHELLSLSNQMTKETAEALAGPFFGASLLPYLVFLYFLDVKENDCPKGVTVGFATCLLFVFLTIPAAITSEAQFGVSLADCDWLHGSAESLLTVTNLVTVLAFRQALNAKDNGDPPPKSATSYLPMTWLVVGLTALAGVTAFVPALAGASVHTPYLAGFMDLPQGIVTWGHAEPENALTVGCWIIHWSSLVEFLVAMGFAWRWADVVGNRKWKGITWGLLPLHSSGITACTYHLFYNSIPLMVVLQAALTCVGNTTAAFAAYRLAVSNGWKPPANPFSSDMDQQDNAENEEIVESLQQSDNVALESESLLGFEDLGDALSGDTDYTFLLKLFAGCAVASYAIKYGELLFDFPFSENTILALSFVGIPSALNAFKWYKRSQDPSFEGWF